MPSPALSVSTYGPIGPIYARLAQLYSGGAIPGCHRWAVEKLPQGARVLIVGSGPGTDVLHAARAGMRVTALDIDAAMLAAAQRRLLRAQPAAQVEFVHADLLQEPASSRFDVVIAQFFLNVFAPSRLPRVLRALAGQLQPGGRLLVGDFAPLAPGRPVLQRLYHDLPMHVFGRLGANAIHAVHDLPTHLREAGFILQQRRRFRLFGIGPRWIEGLEAHHPQ
jgi:ubiquinone/menaquinone biosynthesis C-methylase UbiE